VALTAATFKPQNRWTTLTLLILAGGIIVGIYFSTVRSAFGPAVLSFVLYFAYRGPFKSVAFRRGTYLATLTFALTATLAGPALATMVETELRPYLGRLASSSSSLERNENWRNIQADIMRSPEIAMFGIDTLGTDTTERAHKSGICDNFYYYSIYHWGAMGLGIIAYLAFLPFTTVFGDDKFGVGLWLCACFLVFAAAFTDEVYYLPAGLFAFFIGLILTRQYLSPDDQDPALLDGVVE
jgi:predicted PurR-regulated permease PerM